MAHTIVGEMGKWLLNLCGGSAICPFPMLLGDADTVARQCLLPCYEATEARQGLVERARGSLLCDCDARMGAVCEWLPLLLAKLCRAQLFPPLAYVQSEMLANPKSKFLHPLVRP